MASFSVDFSGVKDGGVAPGLYAARVEKITKEEGSAAPYLKWELKVLTGSAKGLTINHITSLKPEALFNLRNTIIALGIDVPKAALKIDTVKFIGKQLGIEVGTRKYTGDDGEEREYPQVKKTMTVAAYKEAVGSASVEPAPHAKASTPGDDGEVMIIGEDDL